MLPRPDKRIPMASFPMKIPAPFVLILAGLGLLSACSKQVAPSAAAPAAPAAVKIGYLVKQPEEPWFQYEWKGADAAAKKYGYALVKLGVQDGEKVMTAIDSLVAGGAQGFVICTPDVRLGPAIAARAKLKGLKLITVDDRFVSADGSFMADIPYLGMSASKIGAAQGSALYAEMQQRATTLTMSAAPTTASASIDNSNEVDSPKTTVARP